MTDAPDSRTAPSSGTRRRVARVRTHLGVVLACADARKVPARAVDLSMGGAFVECPTPPTYGERLTLLVRVDGGDWVLLPAMVRWVTSRGCGIEFAGLDSEKRRALSLLISSAA